MSGQSFFMSYFSEVFTKDGIKQLVVIPFHNFFPNLIIAKNYLSSKKILQNESIFTKMEVTIFQIEIYLRGKNEKEV